MIVYGWNSFEIYTCRPSEIGLPEDWNNQYIIQRRQKYAHLFWIPFFGIGKIWVLKGRDGNMYEPSIDLHRHLNSLPIAPKTPWYTFIGPILLLAGLIIFTISEKVNSAMSRKRYEESTKLAYQQDLSKIQEAKEGYYYKLTDKESNYYYLKVISANQNSIKCLFSQKQPQSYNDYSILDAFQTDSTKQSFDTVVVNKASLIQSISETGSRTQVAMIPGRGLSTLQEIKYIYEPVFEKVTVGYENGEFLYIIQNKGIPVDFDQFEILTKDSVSTYTNTATVDTKSISIKQKKGIFIFKGTFKGMEPEISALVQFKNKEGLLFTYHLQSRGTHYYLTKHKGNIKAAYTGNGLI